ncbi:hypothetical protein IFR05_001661 [Cadophora sp. M221]|nr:hypothetical protein IFR05_001661 [Cadophora sp. M221]
MGHTAPIFSLEYSADGSRIVSGGEDLTVRVWDAKAFTSYRVLQMEEGCVTISSNPDCSRVFTGSLGGKLLSWNISSDKEAVAETLCVHNDSTFCVQYMPGLHRIVTASRDQTVKVWSMAEAEITKNISTPLNKLLGHKDSVYSVDISPDNKIIFSASGDGSVRLWNSITGELMGTILGVGLQRFHDLCACRPKNLFTTAGHGEGLQIWSYEVTPKSESEN